MALFRPVHIPFGCLRTGLQNPVTLEEVIANKDAFVLITLFFMTMGLPAVQADDRINRYSEHVDLTRSADSGSIGFFQPWCERPIQRDHQMANQSTTNISAVAT